MRKLKCLIVEDEFLIAFHLKTTLARAGYEVCEAAISGEQAVEIARRESPDVILMDIRLLGAMDGIEAAQRIRAFSFAHIIFTTGYSDPNLKERAMVLKPAAYLSKPVNVNQIKAILQPLYGAE